MINAIVDPQWFTIFQEMELWSTDDATRVISAWVAKDFQNADRFERACEWQGRLGQAFTEKIEKWLIQESGLDEIWTRVWRLFCLAEPVQRKDQAVYPSMRKQLESGVVLDSDLRKTVCLLSPKLLLSRRNRELRPETGSQPIERVGDIMRPRMAITNSHRAEGLVNTLLGLSAHAGRILELTSAELRSALELEAELELIGDDFDENDFTVPSIESHAQNRHHKGVNFLIRVLAESLSEAATLDREHTRRVVAGWKSLPGRIGVRLSLHAMRNPKVFEADEAMRELLSLTVLDFWSIRRETALLLGDRAGTASPALVNQVEERIRESGKAYYDRYPLEPGQADWRAHAHDAAVWLRLNMLKDADVLSAIGAAELSAITERRDYLKRVVEDQDFFGAYSSGVRLVIPDPAPIVEASDDDLLQVAQELIDSPEFELRQGWPEFCRSDPQRAFDSLTKGNLTPKTAVLWNQFLGGLAFGEEDSKAIRDDLSVLALNHLYEVDADTLPPMVSGLCDLIFSVPREGVEEVDGWLVKLWETISKQPEEPADIVTGLYERAINSPAGKLSQRLLMEINAQKEGGNDPTIAQLQLIKSISNYKGTSGQLGRAVLVKNLAFLLAIDRQYAVEIFSPCINSKNTEGAALRAVMLRYGSITPEVTQVYKQAIIDGVIESESTGGDAAFIASKILRPVVADFRRDNTVQWGLATTEVARVLRKAKQAVRCGALTVLAELLRSDPAGVEAALELIVTPFFNRVWPKESEFLDASLTPHLIDLAVGSGNEFPKALELLRPYISPYNRGHGSLHAIDESKAPEQFPRETLNLVWLVCGPKSRGSFYEVSEIIDRLIEAEPDIEVDRRLQWLEHRAERYD